MEMTQTKYLNMYPDKSVEDFENYLRRGKSKLKVVETKPKPKKNKKTAITQRGDLFMKIPYSMLDNQEWRISNRSKFVLWAWLISHVVRGQYEGDIFDIYNRYYMNNKLACSRSVRQLMKDFGYTQHKMITKWLNELLEEGAFEKDSILMPGKPKKQTVYILGYILPKDTTEYYYYATQCATSTTATVC